MSAHQSSAPKPQSEDTSHLSRQGAILVDVRPKDTNAHVMRVARQRHVFRPGLSGWPDTTLHAGVEEISQEQLAAEVKSIYAGLTMFETKCIHIDKVQATTPNSGNSPQCWLNCARYPHYPSEPVITDEDWQAMIALHRTLLHEHHDFFLASQHISESRALKRLVLKYPVPARMWKHGIHTSLELLRHRHPESLEYMLAFIYFSYQMMALLYETVDGFRETWIECLGDLGRYRMAVEDEYLRDREIWAGVARLWYNKAAEADPNIGRLWHHLAILARSQRQQQLYLCYQPLATLTPRPNIGETIITTVDFEFSETSKTRPFHITVRGCQHSETKCNAARRYKDGIQSSWKRFKGLSILDIVQQQTLATVLSRSISASKMTFRGFIARLWHLLWKQTSAYTIGLYAVWNHSPRVLANTIATRPNKPGAILDSARILDSSKATTNALLVALGITLILNACYPVAIVIRKDEFWPLPRILSGVIDVLCAAVTADRSGAFDPGTKLPIYITALTSTAVNVYVEHRRASSRAPTSQTQAATTGPMISREEMFWLIFSVASLMTLGILMPWYTFGDGSFATALPIAAWVGGTVCAYIL